MDSFGFYEHFSDHPDTFHIIRMFFKSSGHFSDDLDSFGSSGHFSDHLDTVKVILTL